MPQHLQFLIGKLSEENESMPGNALDSISFYSLCRGLFLPLSMLDPERTASIFGLQTTPPPPTQPVAMSCWLSSWRKK